MINQRSLTFHYANRDLPANKQNRKFFLREWVRSQYARNVTKWIVSRCSVARTQTTMCQYWSHLRFPTMRSSKAQSKNSVTFIRRYSG